LRLKKVALERMRKSGLYFLSMDTVQQKTPLFADGSPARLIILAIVVGLVSGLGAVLFRALIALFHNLLFFGQMSLTYDTSLHTQPSSWGAGVILVPVVGAVIVAFLVKTFAPEAKGHGMPEVIEAVHYHKGVIRPIVAVVKSLASSISIGSGAAVGREGPIIQIGAAFGATLGQLLRLSEWQCITLIAGGAGGGIAATFNTPIGGLLFATELILPEISARTMIPVALSTVTGTFVGQTFFGIHPSFSIPVLTLPPAHLTSLIVFAAYLVLGAILGLVSVVYIRSIYLFEDLFDRIPGGYYVRHMLGMAVVGIMIYLFLHYAGHYYVQGVGYATIQDVLNQSLTAPLLLLVLFAAKLFATSLSLGSGASGGIFSPSLFMGAVLGAAYALLASRVVPGLSLSPTNTAIIGMAALVAGATGAVITAIVMIFEMTRDYHVVVPLMAAVSVAYGVRRLFMADSIYTLKLTRRGHILPESLQTPVYMLRTAGDALSTPMLRLSRDDDLRNLKKKLYRAEHHPHLLIMEAERIFGIISSEVAAREALLRRGIAKFKDHVQEHYVVVGKDDMLFDVVSKMRMVNSDLAVVTRNGKLDNTDDVLGILTWGDIVRLSNLPAHLVTRGEPEMEVETPAERDNQK
jgi:CIC family chloride channel protein